MATILIADDAASIRQLVSFTLKDAGHQILEADNGQKGFEIASSTGKIDLVISDVNMPEMDGIELTKQIRALPNHKGTPILLLTTESAADKKAEGKSAGATGWLVKPFKPEQLVATVNKVIS